MDVAFLQERGDQVVFTGGGCLEIYLPVSYFKEDDLAEERGMEIETIGCFVMKYYKDPESNKYETYQLSLPEDITFSYSESKSSVKEVLGEYDYNTDMEEEREDTYKVFTLIDNDFFIKNVNHVQSFKNTEKLVKLHQKGKLPKTIKYSDFVKLYIENMQTNSTDLQVPSVIIEITVGELTRSKKDIEVPFRKVIGKPGSKVSELDYQEISIKNLAMNTSTYQAVTSENINKALVYSVAKTRTQGSETESPIEPTLKY